MNANCMEHLLEFLRRLGEAKIEYRLDHYREDAISVLITVPGERWEVDFLGDGTIDVERFRSNGHIYGESMLDSLFNDYAADSPEPTSEQIRKNKEEFYQYVNLPGGATGSRGGPLSAANDPAQSH